MAGIRIRFLSLLPLLGFGAGLNAQIVVRGTVTNELNGDRIGTVSVIFDNQIVTTTNAQGTFETPPLHVGQAEFVLAFRRLGYAPQAATVRTDGRTAIQVTVTMRPVPTALEEIVVDGSALTIRNPGLIGFYQRREDGLGRYITEREIDRAKSFDLMPYLRLRLRIDNLQTPCTPFETNFVYVDGIRWFDMETVNRMFAPTTIGGIEVYGKESVHLLPNAFIPPGPACTVTLVWTREPITAASIQLGMFAGPRVAGGGARQGFLGGQIVLPLRDGTSTFRLRAGYAASRNGQGDRWQATIGLSVDPMGYRSNWYVGGGIALVKPVRPPDLISRPMLFSGVFARMGLLRPFAEARMVGSGLQLMLGLNVLLGPE